MNAKEIDVNVLVCGVGGQGNVLAAQVLARAAMKAGYHVKMAETFGMSQRGGPVVSHVRIGNTICSPVVPRGMGNVVLGLEPAETLRTALTYAFKDTVIISNTTPVIPVSVKVGKWEYPEVDRIISMLKSMARSVVAIDATSLAQKAGDPIALSMVMIGILAGTSVTPIPAQHLREALKESVRPDFLEIDLKAFHLGYEAGLRTHIRH